MAKITRAVQKVFADSAGATEIEQIGSLREGSPNYTTDPVELQALARYEGGLIDIVSSDKYIPALEDINALYFLITRQIAYILQDGIPEWDEDTTYYQNSIVKKPGTGDTYISLTDDNVGNALTDVVNWAVHYEPGGIVPLGSIIPFYDFNGALAFNTDKWAYCNGQSKTITGIGAQTLPDLSGRYLVGFGTDGGANIHSAAWDTAAVGNAGHTVNIAHTHGVGSFAGPSHTHTGPSHTHTGPSHTHSVDIASFTSGSDGTHTHNAGSLAAKFGQTSAYGEPKYLALDTSQTFTATRYWGSPGTGTSTQSGVYPTALMGATASGGAHTHAVNPPATTSAAGGTGATGAGGTGATGASGTGAITGSSASALSSAQSIQPRSIRVRYLMRIA